MRNLRNIGLIFITLGLLVGPANPANAQAGTAIKSALKSKAAIKFYDLMAGYLLGKTLDSIYASATQPDPKELDKALGDFKKDHPQYSVMLGTLRRSIKTDGTATTRAEFESLAEDLVFQMDHSLLNSKKNQAPSSQWSHLSASALAVQGQGLGLNRPSATSILDGISPTVFREPLNFGTEPLGGLGLARGRFANTPLPLLTLPKEDNKLAVKLVGAWSFSHRDNAGKGPGSDVYIFHRDGKITEYKVFDRDEIFTFNGTYSVDGKKLTIRWELPNGLGDVLSATIEEVDGGHIKYTPDRGQFDILEPVTRTLKHVSDIGHLSVVTLSNPNRVPFRYEIRWATVDGYWTPWEAKVSEGESMWSYPRQGGFYCQITFDSSFAEGRQEKTYELPFNVVSSATDAKLLDEGGYRIRMEGDDVDLVPEKLTLNQPVPGVR